MTDQPKVYSYIRFSTPEQARGDSLRRQLERSRKWCHERGLKLDESLTIQDLGISAYSGAHRDKGNLGAFIEAIKAGKIQAGSYLIVENLDRLSREEIIPAQRLFLEIIEAGVVLVTLMDNQTYSLKSVNENPLQLIISITVLMRGHEESKTKADRSRNAWQNKRKNAHEIKVTAKCPAWLKLSKDRKSFIQIPERVEIIKLIFKLHTDGLGAMRIARRLNENGLRNFGRADKWRMASIKRILHNKAVLGEWWPRKQIIVDGHKRYAPTGEVIEGYFPRIIDDDTFAAVQHRMAERKTRGGRIGLVKNLFRHIGRCGYCGGKTRHIDLGAYQYLICTNAHASRGCTSTGWAYGDFEKVFLNECKELDVANILPNGNGRARKIKDAQLALEAIQGKHSATEKLISNAEKTIDMAESKAVIEMYIKKLDNALADKEDIEKRLTEAQTALSVAQSETASTDEQLKTLKDLIYNLENTEGDDLIQLRKKLQSAIGQLVERIEVFHGGLGDRISSGNAIEGHRWESVNDVMAHWNRIGDDSDIFKHGEYDALVGELAGYEAQNTGKINRAFMIYFKAGGHRLVKFEGGKYISTVSTMETIMSLNKDANDITLKQYFKRINDISK